jgi:hypothetical protein
MRTFGASELVSRGQSSPGDDCLVQQRPPQIVVATEALASGELTRRDLDRRYTKLHRNVYVRNGDELTAADLAYAAWLWSGRTATLVGHSAAALLGSRWIPAGAPAELAHSRRAPPSGIVVRSDELADHDVARLAASPAQPPPERRTTSAGGCPWSLR